MKRTIPALIAAGACLAAIPAVAHGPFDGYWAVDPAWCEADMYYTHRSAIMIDLPVIQSYDGQCIAETFEPVGGGEPGRGEAWRARLSCSAIEGERDYEAIFAFERDDEGVPRTLVEIGLDDGDVRFLRLCP